MKKVLYLIPILYVGMILYAGNSDDEPQFWIIWSGAAASECGKTTEIISFKPDPKNNPFSIFVHNYGDCKITVYTIQSGIDKELERLSVEKGQSGIVTFDMLLKDEIKFMLKGAASSDPDDQCRADVQIVSMYFGRNNLVQTAGEFGGYWGEITKEKCNYKKQVFFYKNESAETMNLEIKATQPIEPWVLFEPPHKYCLFWIGGFSTPPAEKKMERIEVNQKKLGSKSVVEITPGEWLFEAGCDDAKPEKVKIMVPHEVPDPFSIDSPKTTKTVFTEEEVKVKNECVGNYEFKVIIK